jgi:transcription elongation factor Elf1
MKKERTIIKKEYTCVVCKKETMSAYGILKTRRGKKRCVCSRNCNDLFLRGEYDHE